MTTPAAPPPVRPRRSRARTILPLAIAAWLLLEIWLLITVADAAGGLVVLALLVAGLVLGAMAVKRGGRSAWRSLTAAAGGTSPSATDMETAEAKTKSAALAMLGGLLLIIPGLVSDAVGLLCLFPPTRALLGKAFGRVLERPRGYESGSLGDVLSRARTHRPGGKVVQGEVVQPENKGPDGETGTEGPKATKEPGSAALEDPRRGSGP
jgi:UPF0716 protein FxsA